MQKKPWIMGLWTKSCTGNCNPPQRPCSIIHINTHIHASGEPREGEHTVLAIPYVVTRNHGNERSADIYSAMLEERTIFINGEISDDMAAAIVAQLLFLEATGPQKPISLYINSPGGSVTAGLAIYDTIRHIRCIVHTLCIGQACSMAALLLCAGDERSLLPSSRVMIHQPSGGAEGKQTDIVITAREITRIRSRLSTIISRHTGQPVEKVESDMEKDCYMEAEDALAYGLADKIIMPESKTPAKEAN